MSLIKTLTDAVALFEKRSASDIAVIGSDHKALTYIELARETRRIHHQLQDQGLTKEHRVAAIAPRGIKGIVAFLGVASFSTYAPLPAHLRQQEFENIFEVLQIDALLCAPHHEVAIQSAKHRQVPIMFIEDSDHHAPVKQGTRPDQARTENDIAVLMQTSGSTASPKVVALSHKHIISAALNIIRAFQLIPHDRCLNLMPFYHVHGLVSAGLSSLLAGSSMYCPESFDESRFFEWFRFFKPTWFTCTPTMLQAILDEADRNEICLDASSLRFFRGSSAAVPIPLIDKLERFFDAPLMETYGLTESASLITANPLPPRARKPGSVGLATGAEIKVIDDNGDDSLPNRVGEIIIRGPSVIARYENDPDDTQKAFLEGGWLRTGDLGYFDHEGYLYITDRIKEVINRGGQLVSLREADLAVLKNSAIKLAISFPIDHATLGQDFMTAVVLEYGARATEDEIRQELLESQSSFKVPSGVLIVDAIPVNSIGKIVRRDLGVFFEEKLAPKGELPTTDIETKLLKIWQWVLKRYDLGITDNVFVLGGDPRRAVKVIEFIAESCGVHLSFSQLFLNNTIAKQARLLERQLGPAH